MDVRAPVVPGVRSCSDATESARPSGWSWSFKSPPPYKPRCNICACNSPRVRQSFATWRAFAGGSLPAAKITSVRRPSSRPQRGALCRWFVRLVPEPGAWSGHVASRNIFTRRHVNVDARRAQSKFDLGAQLLHEKRRTEDTILTPWGPHRLADGPLAFRRSLS
jgi:hypothetical protein